METLGTGAAVANILFQIGSYRTIIFDFGTDVSAWTFELFLKKNKGDRLKTISLTLGSGLSFPVYVSDQIQATFSTTVSLIEEGEYYIELRRTDLGIPLYNGKAYFSFDAPQGTADETTLSFTLGSQTIDLSLSNTDFTAALALKQDLATRVQSTTSTATLTPNVDSYDMAEITAQAAALDIAAPTGTPSNGNAFVFRITDNGTARAITFNAIYRAIGSALPTTTTINKTMYFVAVYNSTDVKWDVLPYNEEV